MTTFMTESAMPTIDRQHVFLAMLPFIIDRARVAFRALRRFHDRQDAVANVVARAWEKYLAADATIPPEAPELAAGAVADVRIEMALAGS
jgi:hypothetical protein